MRILLAVRNRAFFFFSLFMPFLFLFGAKMFFAKGSADLSSYILGAVLTLTVMGSFWGLSVQLVTFREQGILRRFRIAPVKASDMLASSIVSNYFLNLPIVAIEIVICHYAFHLRTWGNLWAIFLLVTLGSAAFAAFGLIVASVTNTMQETQMINNLIWMGFLFLSGATIPLAIFPGWLQRFAVFIPATYLATGLEFAATNQAGLTEIVTDLVALAIGLWLAFEVSRQLFRWEPEAKAPRRAKLWAAAALVPFIIFGVWENYSGTRLKQINQNYHALSSEMSTFLPTRK
jgi:ABC-2 type transport system permease protein